MSVLTINEQMQCSTEFPEHAQATISNGYGNRLKQKIKCLSLPKVSATQNRKEKILNIRRQLDSGTYDIKKRLDAATDRLIENLILEKIEEDEVKDTKQAL